VRRRLKPAPSATFSKQDQIHSSFGKYGILLKSLSGVNLSENKESLKTSKKFCGFEKASKFVTANF
jgi:hypothetical protein